MDDDDVPRTGAACLSMVGCCCCKGTVDVTGLKASVRHLVGGSAACACVGGPETGCCLNNRDFLLVIILFHRFILLPCHRMGCGAVQCLQRYHSMDTRYRVEALGRCSHSRATYVVRVVSAGQHHYRSRRSPLLSQVVEVAALPAAPASRLPAPSPPTLVPCRCDDPWCATCCPPSLPPPPPPTPPPPPPPLPPPKGRRSAMHSANTVSVSQSAVARQSSCIARDRAARRRTQRSKKPNGFTLPRCSSAGYVQSPLRAAARTSLHARCWQSFQSMGVGRPRKPCASSYACTSSCFTTLRNSMRLLLWRFSQMVIFFVSMSKKPLHACVQGAQTMVSCSALLSPTAAASAPLRFTSTASSSRRMSSSVGRASHTDRTGQGKTR
jgi:hypothetical protein